MKAFTFSVVSLVGWQTPYLAFFQNQKRETPKWTFPHEQLYDMLTTKNILAVYSMITLLRIKPEFVAF
ncbi:hypothetical protein CN601_15505 [Bacillus sp. AFS017336]|nr:hypothetical protein CN601_15505 [Bacillus sp. AFS017336]